MSHPGGSLSLPPSSCYCSRVGWRFVDAPVFVATDAVEHTYQVLTTIDSAVTRVVNGESGLRGYLLTHDPEYPSVRMTE